MVRIDRKHATVVPARLGHTALELQENAEIVGRIRQIGLQRGCPLVACRRLVHPPLLLADISEIEMRQGVVRLERKRTPITFRRLVETSLRDQEISQMEMQHRRLGLERQRALEALPSLGEPAEAQQGDAELAMRLCRIRPERERTRDQFDRFIGIAALAADHAQQVEAIEVIRMTIEDGPINHRRLVEMTLAMVAEGAGQRILGDLHCVGRIRARRHSMKSAIARLIILVESAAPRLDYPVRGHQASLGSK